MKKLETIKEEDDEEDGLQIIKAVNYVTISDDDDDDDDVKFIKKLPCILDKDFTRFSKNSLIRNQTDKKINFPQILPQKKLIQKNKNQSKDIEYIKKVPLHPRERLKCKKRIKQEPEIRYVKTVRQHPRYRLSRRQTCKYNM